MQLSQLGNTNILQWKLQNYTSDTEEVYLSTNPPAVTSTITLTPPIAPITPQAANNDRACIQPPSQTTLQMGESLRNIQKSRPELGATRITFDHEYVQQNQDTGKPMKNKFGLFFHLYECGTVFPHSPVMILCYCAASNLLFFDGTALLS